MRHQGKVARFSDTQGYGWAILDDSRKSVFIHVNDMRGRRVPREGDRIECEVSETEKGLKALDIALLPPVVRR
jgi:cold shock CspA family protein